MSVTFYTTNHFWHHYQIFQISICKDAKLTLFICLCRRFSCGDGTERSDFHIVMMRLEWGQFFIGGLFLIFIAIISIFRLKYKSEAFAVCRPLRQNGYPTPKLSAVLLHLKSWIHRLPAGLLGLCS